MSKEINLLISRQFSKAFPFETFLLKVKKNDKFGLNYLWRYGSTISFAYFATFFLKIPTVKNFSRVEVTSPPPLRRNMAPRYTEIIYNLTNTIINKYFEF